jgi:hypothetical protein
MGNYSPEGSITVFFVDIRSKPKPKKMLKQLKKLDRRGEKRIDGKKNAHRTET